MSVKQLHSAFPDQGQWLIKLESHVRCSRYRTLAKAAKSSLEPVNVDALVNFLDFKLPVELFSMCLCFAGDGQLQQYPASLLAEWSDKIQTESEQYSTEHGQWPHMAVAAGLAQAATSE